MNFLTEFYSEKNSGSVVVTAQQGSRFAKEIADDFNPIHHPESRRFCVPGDLLFAIAIARYGLREEMTFQFLDLLGAGVVIQYPDSLPANNAKVEIKNSGGKPTLGLNYVGLASNLLSQKESLVRNYVAFSGHNFPDILVPLMREKNVMFNPQRPLVIYQSMHLSFTHFEFDTLQVELAETELSVAGKRGDAKLCFHLKDGSSVIGEGHKILVLSGLRDYDESAIQSMREEYALSKHRYAA